MCVTFVRCGLGFVRCGLGLDVFWWKNWFRLPPRPLPRFLCASTTSYSHAVSLTNTPIWITGAWQSAAQVWIEHHFDDFAQSKELVEALSGFMDLMIAVDMAKQAEHLRKLLLKQLSGGGRTNAVVATGDPPTPHKIPSKKKLSLLDIHPEEVARQLTVVESKMFRAIEATELLGLAWSKDGREERARNVLAMSGRFNEVSRWVATEVLASPRTKVRAVVINRFITIAHKCRLLHNFNSTMEIMAGLQLAPVHRLKQSWALIPTKVRFFFFFFFFFFLLLVCLSCRRYFPCLSPVMPAAVASLLVYCRRCRKIPTNHHQPPLAPFLRPFRAWSCLTISSRWWRSTRTLP